MSTQGGLAECKDRSETELVEQRARSINDTSTRGYGALKDDIRQALTEVATASPPSDPCVNPLHPTRAWQKPLCPVCMRFQWNVYASEEKNKMINRHLEVIPNAYRHHASLRDLRASAKTCLLCELIEDEVMQGYAWRSVPEQKVEVLDPELVKGRSRLSTHHLQLSEKSLQSAILLWAYVRDESPVLGFGSLIRIETSEWCKDELERMEQTFHTWGDMREARKREQFRSLTQGYPSIDVYTLKGDPFESSGVTVRELPVCDSSFVHRSDQIKSWVDRCLSQHVECSTLANGGPHTTECSVPKRLLKISGTVSYPTARLQVEGCRRDRYVALSYCWGTQVHPYSTLTESRHKRFEEEIEVQNLPMIYQDAIKTTLSLGLSHLWIDALCIVQDSPEDWDEESQKMDQYYGNALVTLCVDCANDLSGRLLPSPGGPYEPIYLSQEFPSGETGVLLLSRHVHDYRYRASNGITYSSGLWQANVEVCQLATRAWALQERLLSPRKIHFGLEENFWECRGHRYAEGGEASLGTTSGLTTIATSLAVGNVSLQDWYDLVQIYTVRRLTFQADRLRAISSLAKAFAQVLQSRYEAGLWMNDLQYGLNWHVEGNALHGGESDTLFPSWSWAKSQGAVFFGDQHDRRSSYPREDPRSALTFMSASHVSAANFAGTAPNICLQLLGRLQRVALRREAPFSLFALDKEQLLDSQAAADGGIGDYYGDKRVPRHGDVFWTLQLFEEEQHQGPSIPQNHSVIVLEAIDDEEKQRNCFRRIGAGTIFHDKWFDDCAKELLTII